MFYNNNAELILTVVGGCEYVIFLGDVNANVYFFTCGFAVILGSSLCFIKNATDQRTDTIHIAF